MPHLNEKIIITLCLALSLMHFSPGQASENTLNSVFKFQQTMAQKGHASAQYKLAMFYETGDGVTQNLDEARAWYQQAANQGYKPASHRLKYLSLTQTHATADKTWLKELHRDAQSGEGEALLLLGQMYASGTGVPQELNLASRYLRKAVADNVPGSETELAQLDSAIERNKAERLLLQQQQAESDARQAQRQAAEKEAAEQIRIKQILLQKQIADAQSIRQQQVLAEKQTQLQAKPPVTVKSPTLATREVAKPPLPSNDVTEIDLSPCSGRNRFAATCR